MKFWPFPLFRNYATDAALTDIFLRFAAAKDLTIAGSDGAHIGFTCSIGTLTCWNHNRWYAWAMDGEYTNSTGKTFKWEGRMPSRYAVKALAQRLPPARKWIDPEEVA